MADRGDVRWYVFCFHADDRRCQGRKRRGWWREEERGERGREKKIRPRRKDPFWRENTKELCNVRSTQYSDFLEDETNSRPWDTKIFFRTPYFFGQKKKKDTPLSAVDLLLLLSKEVSRELTRTYVRSTCKVGSRATIISDDVKMMSVWPQHPNLSLTKSVIKKAK